MKINHTFAKQRIFPEFLVGTPPGTVFMESISDKQIQLPCILLVLSQLFLYLKKKIKVSYVTGMYAGSKEK